MWILLASSLRIIYPNIRQKFYSPLMSFFLAHISMKKYGFLKLMSYSLKWVEWSHRVLHNHGDLLSSNRQPLLLRCISGKVNNLFVSILVSVPKIYMPWIYLAVWIQHPQESLCKYWFTRTRLSYDSKALTSMNIKTYTSNYIESITSKAEFYMEIVNWQYYVFIHIIHQIHLLPVISWVCRIWERITYNIEWNGYQRQNCRWENELIPQIWTHHKGTARVNQITQWRHICRQSKTYICYKYLVAYSPRNS